VRSASISPTNPPSKLENGHFFSNLLDYIHTQNDLKICISAKKFAPLNRFQQHVYLYLRLPRKKRNRRNARHSRRDSEREADHEQIAVVVLYSPNPVNRNLSHWLQLQAVRQIAGDSGCCSPGINQRINYLLRPRVSPASQGERRVRRQNDDLTRKAENRYAVPRCTACEKNPRSPILSALFASDSFFLPCDCGHLSDLRPLPLQGGLLEIASLSACHKHPSILIMHCEPHTGHRLRARFSAWRQAPAKGAAARVRRMPPA
jgi:hypothetical protein